MEKFSNNHNIDAKIEVKKGKRTLRLIKDLFFAKEEYVMTCHGILWGN